MSMPAGWYDDGSGRQRWWDGERWTDHLAPGQSSAVSPPQAGAQNMHGSVAPEAPGRVAPVLGFVGLGLAALGTIIACIPATFFLFLVGVIVLVAGFAVSLIGLFKKDAAKWPSVVGMVLSVVGGAVGTVVIVVTLTLNLAGMGGSTTPADPPPAASTTQPTPSSTAGATSERPSPQELAVGIEKLTHAGGITTYDDQPEFFPCMGQYFFDSDLSDEALKSAAAGEDIFGPERELAIEVSTQAALTCDPL